MARSIEQLKERLDKEYELVRSRFDEIHKQFDEVSRAQPEDDLYDRLNELEQRVKDVRTGGWVRPGARHHRRALKKYRQAVAAAAEAAASPPNDSTPGD